MHKIVVENLGKHFGVRVIFRRLSLSFTGGQTLAITGANGSGKSTLIKILAGVLTPSKGDVTLYSGDQVVAREDRPLCTGLVAPYLNVYDGLSAKENLLFLARARRFAGANQRIAEVLDLVGLTPRAGERVATFSSGMKQRVKLAAALLARPPLLLLDEPSSNLDPEGIAMVDRVMRAQVSAGGLLIVATNEENEARRCDRIIRIEDHRA
jgi:heme exporter protein A